MKNKYFRINQHSPRNSAAYNITNIGQKIRYSKLIKKKIKINLFLNFYGNLDE